MSRSIIITLAFLASGALAYPATAAGPVDDPYTVYVTEDGGYAHCGPSPEHYRTDNLSEGDALEVYMETDDGWLGIRPPESSFCWLPSDQVEIVAGKSVGKITDPEAVAWIGTNLGRARKYRWQVQFQLGEPVTVIGQTERDTATGEKEVWYRIVPPAGEFRWVHDSQVVNSRDELALHIKNRATNIAARTSSNSKPSRESATAANDDLSVEIENDFESRPAASDSSVIRQASHDQPIAIARSESKLRVRSDVRVREVESTSPANEPIQPAGNVTPWTRADRSRAPIDRPESRDLPSYDTFSSGSDSSASSQLERYQVDLAQLMARGASAGEAERLRAQVERMVMTLEDPIQRGRSRLLLERIEKYQVIADGRPDSVPTTTAASNPRESSSSAQASTGWLVKVYSARDDAPPYALTDADGKTICYVSPTANLSVSRMLNRRVQVAGNQSRRTDLGVPLLESARVSRID